MPALPDIQSNVKKVIPFFWVQNMKESLEFYVNQLSFDVANKWEPAGEIEWCLLQLGSASIMLQQAKDPFSIEEPGAGVSIYFICEDALAIYREFSSRGVLMAEPFVGNNMWVVEMTDPDGYKLFFESETDVPEETRYSELTP